MKQAKWILPLLVAALFWGYGREENDESGADAKTPAGEAAEPHRRLPASVPKTAATAPSPASPPAFPQARLPVKELDELKRLKECLESENCDYPKTDPQSYALGVGQDVKETLFSFSRALKAEAGLSDEATEAAQEWMRNPDGHIQEGALALFAGLPASPENLAAILDGLKMNPADPLILQQATGELARYMGSPQETQVHQFFSETLTNGALFTAQKAGVVVREVLNPASVSHYREVLKKLPADSTTARHLRGSLEEFDRRRSGG